MKKKKWLAFVWYFDNYYALFLKYLQLNLDYSIIATEKCTLFKVSELSFWLTSDTTYYSFCLVVHWWNLVNLWTCVELLGQCLLMTSFRIMRRSSLKAYDRLMFIELVYIYIFSFDFPRCSHSNWPTTETSV